MQSTAKGHTATNGLQLAMIKAEGTFGSYKVA